MVVRATLDPTLSYPDVFNPAAVGRVSELIWQRGMAVVVDDAVVSVGLLLFVIGLLACFCVAMLVVSVALSVEYLLALAALALFAINFAALLWTIMEAVLSSYKMVVFCFMEVIEKVRYF